MILHLHLLLSSTLSWILAFALLAIRILVLASFLATAVATVVVTATVVVVIIAVAITLVIRTSTMTLAFGRICLRIKALARLAIRELVLVAAFPAAISIVPIATAVVVRIVTTFVAQIGFENTLFGPRTLHGFSGIFALAFLAICKLQRVATFSTAVTTVPSATAVVVPVVTAPVTFPPSCFARSSARFQGVCRFRLCRVQAFAGLTVRELEVVARFSATISIVPVAPTVVVLVIASFISEIGLGTAVAVAWAASLFHSWV